MQGKFHKSSCRLHIQSPLFHILSAAIAPQVPKCTATVPFPTSHPRSPTSSLSTPGRMLCDPAFCAHLNPSFSELTWNHKSPLSARGYPPALINLGIGQTLCRRVVDIIDLCHWQFLVLALLPQAFACHHHRHRALGHQVIGEGA